MPEACLSGRQASGFSVILGQVRQTPPLKIGNQDIRKSEGRVLTFINLWAIVVFKLLQKYVI